MSKSRQNDLIKFDSRMIEFNLARGIITKEEYQKHLASLPDLQADALPLTLEDTDDGAATPEETH